MRIFRFVTGIAATCSVMLGANLASGADYPDKTIRVVAGAAGGSGDVALRLITPGLSTALGQPVVVDNRVYIQGAELVSKSPPDGYTLMLGGSSLWLYPLIQKAPYDIADYVPLSLITKEVNIVSVPASLPVSSIKDLIALAKVKPGQLNYASAGPGSPHQLSAELLKSMAGVNIVGIPYKGGAPAMTALIAGEVNVLITDAGTLLPQMKSGKVKGLAVATLEPTPLVPDLPTVASSGLPGYESIGWTGILAPAKTPRAIVERLNKEIVRAVNNPEVKDRFFKNTTEAVGDSPEEFGAIIKSETAKWGKVVKDANIKVD